jgi:hypothetical protein
MFLALMMPGDEVHMVQVRTSVKRYVAVHNPSPCSRIAIRRFKSALTSG